MSVKDLKQKCFLINFFTENCQADDLFKNVDASKLKSESVGRY